MSTGQHLWILSGGLASGKSKVREMIATAGIMTIDADRIGHSVLLSDGPAFDEVAARWPGVVSDGEINRSALASVVFEDPTKLAALESITHPYIFDTIRAQVERVDGTVVVEVPVISNELGGDWRRIVVDCRDEMQLLRAVKRGMAEESARSRMKRQPSRAEWLAIADVVIPNHGDEDELKGSVRRMLHSHVLTSHLDV